MFLGQTPLPRTREAAMRILRVYVKPDCIQVGPHGMFVRDTGKHLYDQIASAVGQVLTNGELIAVFMN